MRKLHPRVEPLQGGADAAIDVAAPGIVAGAVKDLDPGRAGFEAHEDDFATTGVGVGSLLRGAVPSQLFGLTTTVCPLPTKALMPPRAATAARTSFAGLPPCP